MRLGKTSKKQVDKVRRDVFARDGEQCVVAGTNMRLVWPCAGVLTIQHRIGRGMGSSAKYDAPNSLLAFCAFHNQLETSDANFARYCRRYGWSVPRWVADREMMSRVPVYYGDAWYLLDSFYRFEIPESSALDLMNEVYGG
mgnify:CR=1 FL=1